MVHGLVDGLADGVGTGPGALRVVLVRRLAPDQLDVIRLRAAWWQVEQLQPDLGRLLAAAALGGRKRALDRSRSASNPGPYAPSERQQARAERRQATGLPTRAGDDGHHTGMT
ncbi:hypothetical protein AB9Q10_24900 [Streptomyces krungchingensis]|uniref:hypothetical protein n=1 Tax=Streptomyces krungchingensis TaxID=1565034 RepID=UPI003CF1AC8E